MQDIFGSVRRSLVLRPSDGDDTSPGTLVDKINSCIRKSRVFSRASPPPLIPRDITATAPSIRWRKGELIGCGAFGRVYMGMNLDSGELLAVKQVLIATSNATKEKAQAHIMELEEEVKLLKNLSHPNIVRYLGIVREEETLNILLEFVPGGSISSLLGKFGSFPEAVIRMYTKQLLLGLDYLHNNGIMHRDIKGANILVDNKGCIKLADFGASKQVVELATISGAKSMKGTPYWMAPEVILQTGHSFSADIWSVGCTVIEMATGKPPWSQQYQEVAALFYIGTTKSHPPIPAHLSAEAKDFLLKCLQKEPDLRPAAFELLKHPFVTGECTNSQFALQTPVMENSETPASTSEGNLSKLQMTNYHSSLLEVCEMGNLRLSKPQTNHSSLLEVSEMGNLSCSTGYPEDSESKSNWGTSNSDDDMCQIDDKDGVMVAGEVKFNSILLPDNFDKSFNPISEPSHDWSCEFDGNLRPVQSGMNMDTDQSVDMSAGSSGTSNKRGNDFSFPCGPSVSEDDDEVTESKIRDFLDVKAVELKKLQTPLYEEFYNTLNAACSPSVAEHAHDENVINFLKLPPKSRSPSRPPIGTPSAAVDSNSTASPGSCGRRMSNVGNAGDQTAQDTPSPPRNDWKGLLVDSQQEPNNSPSVSFSEIQRKWKEELDQELERKREMMRQAGVGGKTSSPKDRALNRPRERSRFASPGK